MDETKQKIAFVLGREQEICLAELKAVLSRFCFCFDIYKISGNVVFANVDNFTKDDARKAMNVLSGTMKIFELIGPVEKDIAAQVASVIEKQKTGSEGKINFGISYYGKGFSRQHINSIALTAKKKLKGKFSLRYVESRDSFELSTILTLKNNLSTKGIELGLFDQEVGILIAFNNPEEWNNRDYGKPAFDKYSGMVPPKLARMMVNLALDQIGQQSAVSSQQKNCESQTANCLLIDPFCGSGNILLEAMMLGCDVVGSDISEKAVNDTKANIEWLIEEYKVESIKSKVFEADASECDFSSQLTTYNLQLTSLIFVTEPFLGEPKKFMPTANSAKGEYAKIKELYINFLKNILSLAADSSLVLCLVFPLVETTDGGRFSLFSESVDEIKEMGYTQIRPSLIYGRDYQVVKREIVLLKIGQKSQIQNSK